MATDPRAPRRRTRSPGSDLSCKGEKKPKSSEPSVEMEGGEKFEGARKKGKGVGSADVGDGRAEEALERSVEKEMMSQLWKENEKLKEHLKLLEMSRLAPPPPPPPVTPKIPPMMTPMSPSRRYTPNGTEVPPGTPPGMQPAWRGQIQAWPESLGESSCYAMQHVCVILCAGGHAFDSFLQNNSLKTNSKTGASFRPQNGGCFCFNLRILMQFFAGFSACLLLRMLYSYMPVD